MPRKDELKDIELGKLVLDYRLQPRQQDDPAHVREIVDFIEAGHLLPPIIADRKSLRVTDGFHRVQAYKRVGVVPAETVPVVLRDYRTEAEMMADAIRQNAEHGKRLTSYDKAVVMVKAEALGLTREQVADAMAITVARLEEITVDRIGSTVTREPLIKKRSVKHMETFTKEQAEVNKHLTGWPASFHARQLIMMLDAAMIEFDDDTLGELVRLRELLQTLPVTVAA